MADAHGVMPLVYIRLKAIGGGLVPAAEMEQWQKLYRANAARNMHMTAELLRVLRLFEAHDIPAIPFKGPALAEAAYGDITMRQSADLDILVRERDISRAREALQAQGYTLQHQFTGKQETAHLKRTCEFSFTSSNGAIPYGVDMHFRLAAHYLAAGLDSEGAFDRRQCAQVGGHRINALSADDQLLHLCLHSTLHLWTKLSYICDVAKVVTAFQGWDWPGLLRKAGDAGLRRILLLGLMLASDVGGMTLPSEVEAVAAPDKSLHELQAYVYNKLFQWGREGPTFPQMARFQLKAKERFQDKVAYCLIRAFLPTVEDWRRVDLPDRLYFLYYVLRPLRLLETGIVLPLLRRVTRRPGGRLPAKTAE